MLPLHILYQDEFLVAIDKPPGMLVHPVSEPVGNEWIAMKRLRDQLGIKVFPVHRLDRPTSGVLLFALNQSTAALAQQAFEQRSVTKTYYAIVCGSAPGRWICETPLGKNEEDQPLPAHTSFERIAIWKKRSISAFPELIFSLLKITPTTGRFHQIRRHLLEGGFPIVGDFRYAGMQRCYELGEILGIGTRMLLQAKALEMDHPYTGTRFKIEAPVDCDFSSFFPEM